MVTIANLAMKLADKPTYQGFYSLTKHFYQDDGKVVTQSIDLDKENLEILMAKIIAILIDELPPKKAKQAKLG